MDLIIDGLIKDDWCVGLVSPIGGLRLNLIQIGGTINP